MLAMTSVVQCTPNSTREKPTAATANVANTHASARVRACGVMTATRSAKTVNANEGDGCMARRPGRAVRRNEPNGLWRATTFDDAFRQCHTTVFPRPGNDREE